MFPTTFEQIYVRLYWKGDCDRDTEQLQEWKKTLEKAFLAIKGKFYHAIVGIKEGFVYNCLQNKEFILTMYMYLTSFSSIDIQLLYEWF